MAVARTEEALERARTILDNWVGPSEPEAETSEEIARIERAILHGVVRILDECGGLKAALKRSIALKKQARRQAGRG